MQVNVKEKSDMDAVAQSVLSYHVIYEDIIPHIYM